MLGKIAKADEEESAFFKLNKHVISGCNDPWNYSYGNICADLSEINEKLPEIRQNLLELYLPFFTGFVHELEVHKDEIHHEVVSSSRVSDQNKIFNEMIGGLIDALIERLKENKAGKGIVKAINDQLAALNDLEKALILLLRQLRNLNRNELSLVLADSIEGISHGLRDNVKHCLIEYEDMRCTKKYYMEEGVEQVICDDLEEKAREVYNGRYVSPKKKIMRGLVATLILLSSIGVAHRGATLNANHQRDIQAKALIDTSSVTDSEVREDPDTRQGPPIYFSPPTTFFHYMSHYLYEKGHIIPVNHISMDMKKRYLVLKKQFGKENIKWSYLIKKRKVSEINLVVDSPHGTLTYPFLEGIDFNYSDTHH
jgi:hypothetical protein